MSGGPRRLSRSPVRPPFSTSVSAVGYVRYSAVLRTSAGVSIAVYGIQTYHSPDAQSSESVAYTLDGAAPVVNATIELQGSPTVFMFPLFDSGPLPDGQHTLEVRNDGTTLILTYFKVGLAGSAESSPASSVTAASRTTSSTSE